MTRLTKQREAGEAASRSFLSYDTFDMSDFYNEIREKAGQAGEKPCRVNAEIRHGFSTL